MNSDPVLKTGRFSEVLAGIIVLASVIFLAWTANFPKEEEDDTSTEPQTADAATDLAILKLQSRVIIGVSQFEPKAGRQNARQLEATTETTRGKIAMATVYAFLDSETDAFRILDSVDESADLVAEVRRGISDGISNDQRDELKKKIGWFADLVKPSSGDPNFGEGIRKDAMKTFGIYIGFIILAFLAFLTGLVLLILYFVFRSNGKLKQSFNPCLALERKHLFLEAFAFYIGVMALGHLLGYYISHYISFAAYVVSFVGALIWPVIRGCSWKETRSLIGWNRGRGFFKEVLAGFIGYFGILVIAGASLLLTLILLKIFGASPGSGDGAHPIVGLMDNASSWKGRLFIFFFAAGAAPLLEETMFRGALHRYFRHGWGLILSAVVGGVIFAVIHPQGWIAVPALTGMAVGFALLREWRDSLIAPMTAHAINNGVLVCFLLLLV